MSQTTHQPSGPFYIGIDFHKHYSVFCVIDDRNTILERGRIDHKIPIGFELLIKRYPGCRVVFETTMNWHWLYEVLDREEPNYRKNFTPALVLFEFTKNCCLARPESGIFLSGVQLGIDL